MKLSHADYVRRVHEANPNIIIVGVYTGIRQTIDVKCKICDHPWSPPARRIVKKTSSTFIACSKCKSNLLHDEFCKVAKSFGITVIGDYKGSDKKVDVKCDVCDHHWPARGDGVTSTKNHKGCPECGKNIISQEDFERRVKENNPITVIGEYKHSHQNIDVKCDVCDHPWSPVSSNLIAKSPRGCPICGRAKNDYHRYKNIPTTLYLLDIKGTGVKPGLSQRKSGLRFLTDKNNGVDCKILYEIHYQDGWEAWKHEKFILDSTKDDQMFWYNKDGPLVSGNTEIRAISSAAVIIDYFQELQELNNQF